MSKIFTVVGARPNFIKIDPKLPQTIVHTGQHRDYHMSTIFFKGMNLPKPAHNLGSTDVGRMIDKLRTLFKKEQPALVVVIGDTNSSLAGALAASMENIKVAHVESGLRSNNLSMPEEKNRIVIDTLSTIRLCPNQNAAMNLLKEGIKDGVYIVGDPLFDAMGHFTPIKKTKDYQKYILLTTHRNFNVDNKAKLQDILDACAASGQQFICPIHPRTKKMLGEHDIRIPENIKFINPQGYKQMLSLISNAKKVVTDSGGVQREAFWMNVPIVLLREETEWPEIINKGCAILVGTDRTKIESAIKNFKGSVSSPPEPHVNERIRKILFQYA